MVGKLAVSKKSVQCARMDKVNMSFLEHPGLILGAKYKTSFGNIYKFYFLMPVIWHKVLSVRIFLRVCLKRKTERSMRDIVDYSLLFTGNIPRSVLPGTE